MDRRHVGRHLFEGRWRRSTSLDVLSRGGGGGRHKLTFTGHGGYMGY